MKTRLKSISAKLEEALKGGCPTIVLMESKVCSMYPPTDYLGEAEETYASLIKEVLRKKMHDESPRRGPCPGAHERQWIAHRK